MREQEKLSRLAYVAGRYYIDDQKQSDIAKELGVSRPLISRMLSEARELGVVEIIIHSPDEQREALIERLSKVSSVKTGLLVPSGLNDKETNQALSQAAFELIERIPARRLGVGWGHFIGQMVENIEKEPVEDSHVETICPLLGNSGFPVRNYHTSENVRVLAEGMHAKPHFLYLPALAESFEEKQLLCSTELYHQIEEQWRNMDTALVNIGNYPSTPDFASVARYGSTLHKQKACGRLLAYFFNEKGQIISSDHDFAIQIPIETLAATPNIIGLCSANTSVQALRGALNTGLFTGLVARQSTVEELLAKDD